jgi:hypothetical protein
MLLFLECHSFNKYLDLLSNRAKPTNILNAQDLRIKKDIPICREKRVEIDSLFLNIYDFKEVCFKRDSDIVVLKLKDRVHNIFYVDKNNEIYKLSNDTKIVSSAIRNILVYELDIDRLTNAIVFNSK